MTSNIIECDFIISSLITYLSPKYFSKTVNIPEIFDLLFVSKSFNKSLKHKLIKMINVSFNLANSWPRPIYDMIRSITLHTHLDKINKSLPPFLKELIFNHTIEDNFLMTQPFPHDLTEIYRQLTHLTLFNQFNQPLCDQGSDQGSDQGLVLPTGLIELTFGRYFNQPIAPGILPSGLKKLKFGCNFNQYIVPGLLPIELHELDFGWCFNQPLIPGSLPCELKSLKFGWRFNQPLIPGSLPNGLTELSFGNNFNQSLNHGILPHSLITLNFGRDFNKALSPGVLPGSLKTLTLGCGFYQPLGQKQDQEQNQEQDQEHIQRILPMELTQLNLCRCYESVLPINVPAKLTRIVFYNNLHSWHINLKDENYLRQLLTPEWTILSNENESLIMVRHNDNIN